MRGLVARLLQNTDEPDAVAPKETDQRREKGGKTVAKNQVFEEFGKSWEEKWDFLGMEGYLDDRSYKYCG